MAFCIPTHVNSVSETLSKVQSRVLEVEAMCLLVRLKDGTSMNASFLKRADLAVELVGALSVVKAELVKGLGDGVLIAVDGDVD